MNKKLILENSIRFGFSSPNLLNELNQEEKRIKKEIIIPAISGNALFSKCKVNHIEGLVKAILPIVNSDWKEKANEIIDYLAVKPNIPAIFTWDEIVKRSDEFHERMKKKNFSEKQQEIKNIVYEEGDFYVVHLKDAESLDYEGRYIGHCVGSYAKEVANENTDIFSLRNRKDLTIKGVHIPANQPINTIEINEGIKKQAYGNGPKTGNVKPDNTIAPVVDRFIEKFISNGYWTPERKERMLVKDYGSVARALDRGEKFDERLQLLAVKKKGTSLELFFKKGLNPSQEVINTAILSSPIAVKIAKENGKAERVPESIYLQAIKNDPDTLFFMSNNGIQPTEEMVKIAINKEENKGHLINTYLRTATEPSEDLKEFLVSKDAGALFAFYRRGFKISYKIKELALQENGLLIREIIKNEKNIPEELMLAAVRNFGHAIDEIYRAGLKPSDAVQIEAVKNEPKSIIHIISYIKPSEDVMLAAIESHPNTIKYLIEKFGRNGIPRKVLNMARVKRMELKKSGLKY